jgi:hypothetical protein
VSSVPAELRDALVGKLEAAIAERDDALRELEGDAATLHAASAALEADVHRLEGLAAGLRRDLKEAGSALDRERREAHARVERLRSDAERQRAELARAIADARAAHRRDWDRLAADVTDLRKTRDAHDAALRAAAVRAIAEAISVLGGVDEAAAEAMDLAAELHAARRHVADANALRADEALPPSEWLAAARGALESALGIAERVHRRTETLAALRQRYRDDAGWLQQLVAGRPVSAGLPDQVPDVELLVAGERDLMAAMIERHVDLAARELTRWNGHGMATARIEGVRDRLAGEALRARQALVAAAEHERRRYAIDWLWRDLELRAGGVRDEGDQTPGYWSDPADRKSTYRFVLRAAAGEVAVDVPWEGPVQASLDQRPLLRAEPPHAITDDIRWIGHLRRRLSELAVRLDNPAWTPEAG